MAWKQLAAFISLTHFFILSSCAVQFHYNTPPETVLTADDGTRIRGFQDRSGDLILGGLFAVHTFLPESDHGQCTDTERDQGIQSLEAMLYAIDVINSDPDLLPNITLGYDIRDTCRSEKIGLDESPDMVLANDLESCLGNSKKFLPDVMAVIGPLESHVSIQVASFFCIFQMPQVSYASSSTILNNRNTYSYFFRTYPATDSQVQAIVDIILHYKWNHVSAIFSHNLYGESLIDHLRNLSKAYDICLDFVEPIYRFYTQPDYLKLARELMTSYAKVVVLFTIQEHTESLLSELQDMYDTSEDKRRFLWIASYSVETVVKFKEMVAGMWGVVPSTKPYVSFENYYSKLLTQSNIRNPWFEDYYQEYFDCFIGRNCSNVSVTSHPDYQQYVLVPPVIDAVYSVAHAIHNSIMDNCPKPVVWHPNNRSCQGQNNTISGEMLANYLYNVNFTSPTGNTIQFDKFGIIEAKFNYQVVEQCSNCSKTYRLDTVAHWDSTSENHLRFYQDKRPQFGIDSSGEVLFKFESQCKECDPGFIKRLVVSSCCGTCDPCLGPNYTNSTSSTECEICPDTMWGNNPVNGSTGCVDIEESYLKPSDPWAIILMIIAIIGLILTVFVGAVFIWFWNTPIVKSSGREQMILLLTGIVLCFLITIVFLIKPSPAVCGLQRIGSWFCFSLILSALFVKLVRITRIFIQGKTSPVRPKCIGPEHQILLTFLLVGIQMILVGISLSVVPPRVTENLQKNETNQDDFPVLIIQCTSPHIALVVLQMVYFTALIIASNALAILTIQFPQNFNESKYVAFSTFALTLMWILVFIPSYIATAGTTIQTAVTLLTIQLSAVAVLLCLFGPRVFIMIVWPKRNVQTSTAVKSSSIHHTERSEKSISEAELK